MGASRTRGDWSVSCALKLHGACRDRAAGLLGRSPTDAIRVGLTVVWPSPCPRRLLRLTSGASRALSAMTHIAHLSQPLHVRATAGDSGLSITAAMSDAARALRRRGLDGGFARGLAILLGRPFVVSPPFSSGSAAASAVPRASPFVWLARAFVDKQSLADTAAERSLTAR